MPIHVCHHEYWTPEEIADQFPPDKRPSIETIRRYIRTGRLQAVKFGPTYLITSWAIARLLAPNTACDTCTNRRVLNGNPTPQAPESPTPKLAGPRQNAKLVRPRLLPRFRPDFKRALAQEVKAQHAKSKRACPRPLSRNARLPQKSRNPPR